MPDTYDVIICGAGAGGGYLAGEIAANGSVLLLDAGPHVGASEAMAPGVGSPSRRKFSTQINLGRYIPDSTTSGGRGNPFFAYPIYMDQSNPVFSAVQREPRVVGGGTFLNVGAWVRPRTVDFEGFAQETGVRGWSKQDFEPFFQQCEKTQFVHRTPRENWNPGSVAYEKAAAKLGIKMYETSTNKFHCIFCGHRLDAGMPCKYDSLMGTAQTQIPKAMAAGATVLDNATVLKVEITNKKATGVTYIRNGVTTTATARKLVVVAAGAIGTPAILYSSGVWDINKNVGQYLRAHPGIAMDALVPEVPGGGRWNTDRGYQWNCYHYPIDEKGQPVDVIIHASAGFPAATPWVAAQVGFFGQAYKDLMRRYPQRVGAFHFQLKPSIYGRVMGGVEKPVISYPVATVDGVLEPKILSDFTASIRTSAKIFKEMGAIDMYPNPNLSTALFNQTITQLVTTAGALHPQGTCRAGASRTNSVVDTNCMSHDIDNLMCCDASVIPHHISSNPNSMIMAIGARAGAFVRSSILNTPSKNLSSGEAVQ